MLRGLSRLIACGMVCAFCFGSESQTDTIRLAAHLKPFRRYKTYEISGAQYKTIQQVYLSWIAARMKSGVTLAQMNEELRAAHLLSDGPTVGDDMEKSFAGFLGLVEALQLGVTDLVALKFGIYGGSFCNLDETAVLYDAETLEELARINAETVSTHGSRYGFRLRGLAVGKDDGVRGRIIGSDWVMSNCTSNWNGNAFRIDVSRGHSIKNILERELGAFGRVPVRISVEGNTVTVKYTTMSHDGDKLLRAGIAIYRVQGDRVSRQGPIALSFGGFIDEWLDMSDNEAAHWSTPEASARHHELVARFSKGHFRWNHAAVCPGSPPAREIGIQWNESKQNTFFLIRASSAADMRMVSIYDHPSSACSETKMDGELSSILAEPR